MTEPARIVPNRPDSGGSPLGGLSPRQRGAVALLVECRSHAEACRRGRLAKSTLAAWMKSPAFARALADAQKDVYSSALGRLKTTAGLAVEALRALLTRRGTPPAVVVAAAGRVLDGSRQAVELLDILGEIEKLKAKVFGGDRV